MRRTIVVCTACLALVACSDDGETGDAGSTGGTGGSGGSAGTAGAPPVIEAIDELVADQTLALPVPGTFELRVISPVLLELRAITTKDPDPAPLATWSFVDGSGTLTAPSTSDVVVKVNGASVTVSAIGLRRRVLHAPLAPRDLRIDNRLFLELALPLGEGAKLELEDPNGVLGFGAAEPTASYDVLRRGPALHVNQVGYTAGLPKKARVGYYLGSLGEMAAPADTSFSLIRTKDGSVAFQGTLSPNPEDQGGFLDHPYQNVMQADFSGFDEPGNYRLLVPGLGASYPFWIGDGAAAAFTRTYALGLYHQRCGAASELPFTRFVRGVCHAGKAQIPTHTPEFEKANALIAATTKDFTAGQTAPIVSNVETSLYPFQKSGSIDVSGGHHDAGDYSKYTLNSAQLIHTLLVAVDDFPGVADLDNLGLPESGDGKSDVLHAAKWEADFLAKMQDSDGGFFTLVYPKERAYEDDVMPDEGDPQIVWPKSTAVTAAAVGALAEIGSSPRFRATYSEAAGDAFVARAKLGWQFLEQAITKYGKQGSFQVVYHYGAQFQHDDELAWAAAALFAATGETKYHDALMSFFPDPSDPETFQWGWWRSFAGWGAAERDYAFAVRSGRRSASEMDASYLAKCEQQLKLAGSDQRRWSEMDAYGTSFPDISKHYKATGWYFSSSQAFDATVAYQLDPKPELLETVIANMNFEGGTNPANVSYVTGLGWHRPHEIVFQQARNDRARLPPSGIAVGNTQAGFMWLELYGKELDQLSFPHDQTPIYDRWADTFDVTTEAVSLNLARSLASLAFVMAKTPAAKVAWRSVDASIQGVPSSVGVGQELELTLAVEELSLGGARFVWEASGVEPSVAPTFTWSATSSGPAWVEVEAQWPDGRRAHARRELTVQ